MKATAIAHPNVALIKYWGKKDEISFLPMNNSISVTVDSLYAKITLEFSDQYKEDSATLNGKQPEGKIMQRTTEHLNRIRKLANIDLHAKGAVEMNFPIGAGLASSAAGFAALTVAASKAAGLKLSKKQLSILSRQGSGSSCRSIHGGYVEWKKGTDSENSYAVQLADKDHLDMRIITCIVSKKERVADTRGGMKIAQSTSPLYKARLDFVKKELPLMKKAILDKDFKTIGSMAERDCMLLHATAITADPVLLYWVPESLRVMHAVRLWRTEGLEAYYTIDTGANVHVLCMPENQEEVISRLKAIPEIIELHVNKPGEGAKLVKGHVF